MKQPTKKQLRCIALVASDEYGALSSEDTRLDKYSGDKRTTDTLNECFQAGWLRSTFNDLTDSGSIHITPAGRAALKSGGENA